MIDKPRIFNIPANYHFFESLFSWLEKNFGENLSQVFILLPNRRACRELRDLFMQKKRDFILPKIKAISDISYEDFFEFLPSDEAKAAIDELLQIKVLSGIDGLFFLTQEIRKLAIFGNDLDFNQAFKIAAKLQELFDEIEREEVDLDKIMQLDDADLSRHRQLSLEFLKSLHVQVKNSLLKQNIFFASSQQNLITEKFCKLLEARGSSVPMIIAGSTGSVSFGKKLIRAISRAKNGNVILYGLTDDEAPGENHPQFFLRQLLEFLKVERSAVEALKNEAFRLSPESRQTLLSFTMLEADKTIKWQKAKDFLDSEKLADDLQKNFRLVEARNEIEEAKIISMMLRESPKSALVTNNRKLADLVKAELEIARLQFNDTRNQGIFNSSLVNFLLLILELRESDFNSHNLLALLKHPLSSYSDLPELCEFEMKILRKQRFEPGISGIRKKLLQHGDAKLTEFFENFYKEIETEHSNDLERQTTALIATAENLSKKTWQKLLEHEEAEVELFEFFEKLKMQANIEIDAKNLHATFKNLFAQISFFKKSEAKAGIQILSTLEARLLNYDLMIIASLNEGDFPEIESQNWLGKKIKKDLQIDRAQKKFGQNAYDFCNYLSNSKVVLTRSKSRNGAALIESPFLLKFKTICKKLNIELDGGKKYLELFKKLNSPALVQIKAPQPRPKKDSRPKKISITDISKLLANPYHIYAKKILHLKELEKIDFEPGYAEFGSFVHAALEHYIKNPQKKDFEDLFEEFFHSKEAKLVWWPKFQNIFSDFLLKNEEFDGRRNIVEKPVEFRVGEVLVSGIIDRVIFDDEGNVEIFDYKTGQVPSKKSVFEGKNPQLTLAALALAEEKIKSLNYWKLSASSPGEITKIEEDIQILLSAAQSGLTRLFEYFSDEKNPYSATQDDENSEYKNLMRNEEWNR